MRTRAPPLRTAPQQHRDWLSLVEVSGPVPQPAGAARHLAQPGRAGQERSANSCASRHAAWQADPAAGQRDWIRLRAARPARAGATPCTRPAWTPLAVAGPRARHRARRPSFALVEPGGEGHPATSTRLLRAGLPTRAAAHRAGSRAPRWAATPVDRLAQLCRHHGVELGLVTDGRWWALVWAPRGGVTTTAVFDAVAWPEAAERDRGARVRVAAEPAPLLRRAATSERLARAAAQTSLDSQEEITEALGVQVRQAVELLVAAIGRADRAAESAADPGLRDVSAHEVYRGAVAVMMRIVFLLFAEERRLLPADNELYAAGVLGRPAVRGAGAAGQRGQRGGAGAQLRRLAPAARPVHRRPRRHRPSAAEHARPRRLAVRPARRYAVDCRCTIDDRTVLHMLRAVQYVEVGTGRSRERRTLSFRAARRRADRLRLRGPAVVRGLPRRRGRRSG